MSKFKAGDKVVSKVNITNKLVKGAEYTVYKIGPAYGSIYLEAHWPAFSPLSFYTLAEAQMSCFLPKHRNRKKLSALKMRCVNCLTT